MKRPLDRTVLMDATFLDALMQPAHVHHEEARVRYEALAARYEEGTVSVVTHEWALAATTDPERARRIAGLADIEPVDGDTRREVVRIRADEADTGLDDAQLATVVVLVRRRIDELLTFDPALALVPPPSP